MIEPLHWRGDRATMNAFNATFVTLMGTKDIGPINNAQAGLSAAQMELFRQFSLGMTLPPNPFRAPDDTIPNALVTIPGHPFTGNPTEGQTRFLTVVTDIFSNLCVTCHASPSGTAGGKLGGINPGDPIDAAAALIDGNRVLTRSAHNDLKIPHLRNLYTKLGLLFGTQSAPRENKSGFGFSHDGSMPDLVSFLSLNGFGGVAQAVWDESLFMLYFPGGVRPAVGQNLTVPAGPPPTGSTASETLLATLIQVGNLADPGRHCELVASGRSAGRARTWYLNGGMASGGLFTTDVEGEPPVATTDLRQNAEGPLTFLCATVGSGIRLGADRDLDTGLNGDDCAPADAGAFATVPEATDLDLSATPVVSLAWSDQSPQTGAGIVYDVAGGDIDDLVSGGVALAAACLAGDIGTPSFADARPDPPPGKAHFYLIRGRNACGAATFGADGGADGLVCDGQEPPSLTAGSGPASSSPSHRW
jgi:hypothetical protein